MAGAEPQPDPAAPATSSETDPETARKGALKAALGLLNRRDYASRELAARLSEKHFPEDAVERVIDDLTGLGYLNDERLAERMVEDAVNRRHHGPRRIRHDLAKRKIPESAYADALARYSDRDIIAESARMAALSFFKGRTPSADAASLRRLAGFLGRRGFADGTIHAMLHLVRQGRLEVPSDAP